MSRLKDHGLTAEKVAKYFKYLDTLRDSGITNMFGAGPYLMKAHKLQSRAIASDVLAAWMTTCSDEKPDIRAKAAMDGLSK